MNEKSLALLLALASCLETAASADMLAREKEDVDVRGFISLTVYGTLPWLGSLGYLRRTKGLFVTLQARKAQIGKCYL